MKKYYLKAHYPQGEMFERFEGELSGLYKQIKNGLAGPENFNYEISGNEIDDFNPCTMDDLKTWAE